MQRKKKNGKQKNHLCYQKQSDDLNFAQKQKMFLCGLASQGIFISL